MAQSPSDSATRASRSRPQLPVREGATTELTSPVRHREHHPGRSKTSSILRQLTASDQALMTASLRPTERQSAPAEGIRSRRRHTTRSPPAAKARAAKPVPGIVSSWTSDRMWTRSTSVPSAASAVGARSSFGSHARFASVVGLGDEPNGLDVLGPGEADKDTLERLPQEVYRCPLR